MAVGGTWVEAEGSISNFQNWKKNGREWRWAKSASSVYSQRSGRGSRLAFVVSRKPNDLLRSIGFFMNSCSPHVNLMYIYEGNDMSSHFCSLITIIVDIIIILLTMMMKKQ
jgi:hypothetical protein